MRKSSRFPLVSFAVAVMTAAAISCSTQQKDFRSEVSENRSTPVSGVPIPGFEILGSPAARRKADVLARFGRPTSEESLRDGRYTLLTYPVSGWEERLVILFADEELLAFSRESSRAVLDSTIQHHARTSDGSVVIFQSWANGQTQYFRATPAQLESAPKRESGSPPPLSEEQALEHARQWFSRTKPGSEVQPSIQGLHEVPRFPGAAFYVVGVPDLATMSVISLVVLMDGTIITGEREVNP